MNRRRVQIEPYGEDMWEVTGYDEQGLDVLHGYYPSYDEANEAADLWITPEPEPEMPSLSHPTIDLNLLADIVHGLLQVTNRIDRQVQAIEGLTRALGGLLLRPEKEEVEQ